MSSDEGASTPPSGADAPTRPKKPDAAPTPPAGGKGTGPPPPPPGDGRAAATGPSSTGSAGAAAPPKPAAPAPAAATAAKPAPPKPAAKPAPPRPAGAAATAAKPTPPRPAAKPAPPKPAGAASKPAKPPPPPPPEFETKMTARISERFGDRAEIIAVAPNRTAVRAAPDAVKEVAAFIRDELNFDHAESVSGVDYPKDNEIEVVYHLGSYLDPSLARQILALHVRAPREDSPDPGGDSTRLPSLRDVFYSVEFHERECFEMLGVYFEGHPDNRRLLLPEDWADLPPLRKDFAIKGR